MKREPHDGSIQCVRFSIVATAECDKRAITTSALRERRYSASQLPDALVSAESAYNEILPADCVSSRNTGITVIPAVRIS